MCDTCATTQAPATVDLTTTPAVTYQVEGMTCGHCEQSIRAEVGKIPGVTTVTADAATGLIAVTADTPVDEEALRAAVDEAGYRLTGPAR
ncbi:copper chaperone CopZ [Stackebrandtia albiflava]|uniref:Copper chaperone CopZ n=1 Tax=Stackebrandtia albiflava TaxID=406432 RepID=A0A562V1V9_9ACTN|nr:cation transporter [Stackebrandtia albiflava]TWJ11864.1 copper chaperone CopZ [Stackebrandtia albiflava]